MIRLADWDKLKIITEHNHCLHAYFCVQRQKKSILKDIFYVVRNSICVLLPYCTSLFYVIRAMLMSLLLVTFAKCTHVITIKAGSLLRFWFLSILQFSGDLWEGCELWGCTFVKVHSPVRESEPSKVIARSPRGGKQTFFKHVHTKTHMHTFPEKSKPVSFFAALYMLPLHLLFYGLCAVDSFVCLMFLVSDFHLS